MLTKIELQSIQINSSGPVAWQCNKGLSALQSRIKSQSVSLSTFNFCINADVLTNSVIKEMRCGSRSDILAKWEGIYHWYNCIMQVITWPAAESFKAVDYHSNFLSRWTSYSEGYITIYTLYSNSKFMWPKNQSNWKRAILDSGCEDKMLKQCTENWESRGRIYASEFMWKTIESLQ